MVQDQDGAPIGDVEIVPQRRGVSIAVVCLDNPLPAHLVGLDVYPNGRVNLYERGSRDFIIDSVNIGRRVNKGSVEAFDRGRTLILEIELAKDQKKEA